MFRSRSDESTFTKEEKKQMAISWNAMNWRTRVIAWLVNGATGALHNKLTFMIHVISIACNHLGMML